MKSCIDKCLLNGVMGEACLLPIGSCSFTCTSIGEDDLNGGSSETESLSMGDDGGGEMASSSMGDDGGGGEGASSLMGDSGGGETVLALMGRVSALTRDALLLAGWR